MSRSREIIKPDNAHVLNSGDGTPVVIIDRSPTSATVWVSSAPWGFGTQELTVLNPRPGGKADRHALHLKQRLEYAAARELERRARIKANGGAK